MHWADELADKIIASNQHKPYWVDDMKTPSGIIHVGSLRGVLIHDLVYKALLDKGQNPKYTYVYNDMDPMDKLPHYIDPSYKTHLGKPFFKIPAPDGKSESYARQFANDFTRIMNHIGAMPKILWSSELYHSGHMNEVIKTALDNVEKIRRAYLEIAEQEKPDNWYPFQVICPQCGKLGSTLVTSWDGKNVHFVCKKDMVSWAKGCEYEGDVSPLNGTGKLMWKVDWPAHWKSIGITIEGAGKDHTSAGGSRDIAVRLLKTVFDYPNPFDIPYEWFLISGRKMSTSKGVGTSAQEFIDILPPYLARFVFVKNHFNRQINFDPNGDTIPDLFDAFDETARAYWGNGDPKLARMFELTQVNDSYSQPVYLPRFRDLISVVQDPKQDAHVFATNNKGEKLTSVELEILEDRIKYVQIWLKDYAPDEVVMSIIDAMPKAVLSFTDSQRQYLTQVADLLFKEWSDPQDLQQAMYTTSKDMGLPAKQAFGAIYQSLLDKSHGPKAAWFLLENKETAITRLREAATYTTDDVYDFDIQVKSSPRLSMSDGFESTYPTASMGYAIIEGVTVKDFDQALEDERQGFANTLSELSTIEIGSFPEIKSYRQMYNHMGVDWHSKRPSPEALLRRIATGKGIHEPINTCVDAYNLIVMKHRVSAGAFDLDKLKFPCEIKIADGGESALFIGDTKEPTTIQAGEVSYFDQLGPYNVDYNYRDAIRTAVTTHTKNLWINTEGIYDIPTTKVKQVLDEVIAIVQKYCGGTVKDRGIIITSPKAVQIGITK